MRRRLLVILSFLVIAFLVVTLQLAFINTLPGVWGRFNPLLLTAVFVLFFFDLESALIFALALGLWLDIFSFVPFGFNISLLILTVLALHLLLTNWLTNRSFYSFAALALAAVLINNVLSALIVLLASALGPDKAIFWFTSLDFWRRLAWQLLGNLVLSLLFFNLMSLVGRKVKICVL
ncbi:MAG: hypothetical protein NTX66_03845 [Candidatus Falkowbacteria bacterium]|nr:hypothetical protein [Candidatus Falkowbacteria bacterium]